MTIKHNLGEYVLLFSKHLKQIQVFIQFIHPGASIDTQSSGKPYFSIFQIGSKKQSRVILYSQKFSANG